MRLVVHVEPFNASLCRNLGSSLHQFSTDSPTLKLAMHSRVQNEAVNPAIPGHIDEADETRAVERADIRQALLEHLSELVFSVVLPDGGEEMVEVPV